MATLYAEALSTRLELDSRFACELGPGAAHAIGDAAARLVLAETMGNDDDKRFGHLRAPSPVYVGARGAF
jgi:hypothetical protein